MYLVQRVQMESLDNYLFFATLTYNKESLPHIGVSTGFDIPFADVHDLQNCFKRIRNNNLFTRPFKYLFVSELGSKRGRPHFHVLFILPKIDENNLHRFEKFGISVPDNEFTPYNLEHIMFRVLLENWSRNVGTEKIQYINRFAPISVSIELVSVFLTMIYTMFVRIIRRILFQMLLSTF